MAAHSQEKKIGMNSLPFIAFQIKKLKTKEKTLLHNCTLPVLPTYLFMVNKTIGGEIFAIWFFEKNPRLFFDLAKFI